MTVSNETTYLGQFPVDLDSTEFKGFTPSDWALRFIQDYGGIDGEHHKDWVLDQVARVLNGTPVLVEEAKWSNGETHLRYMTGNPSKQYHDWVAMVKSGEDGPDTYSYEEGIAP